MQEVSIRIDDGDEEIEAGTRATLWSERSIQLTRNKASAQVESLGGETAVRPILIVGPFVMDSAERLTQARHDFFGGEYGLPKGRTVTCDYPRAVGACGYSL